MVGLNCGGGGGGGGFQTLNLLSLIPGSLAAIFYQHPCCVVIVRQFFLPL